MSLNVNDAPTGGGSKFLAEVMDPGTYPGRLVHVIDLGIQKQDDYEGQKKDPAKMVNVTYEFSDEFMKDEDGNELTDQPRFLSEMFNVFPLSSEKAKSTGRYLALDPNVEHGGDLSKLLGAPCLITVVNKERKGKIYNNVGALSAMRPKDAEKLPPLVKEPKLFDLDDPDLTVFLSLPDFIQEKIKQNMDFKGSALEALLDNHKPESKEDTSEGVRDVDDQVEVGNDDSSDDEDW